LQLERGLMRMEIRYDAGVEEEEEEEEGDLR
jgi:hypothetical protein